ncbi:MAG: PDZ domain-containing protein [Phycisphaerales bacterium]|nr:PDZ domain-containing protein [Phycisphaerales bacterium]
MVRALAPIALVAVAGCASAPTTDTAEPQAEPAPQQERRPRIDVVLTGERPTVWIDGTQVADEHLKHSDDAVEIVSSSGDTLHRIPLPVAPDAPPVMLGARLEVPGPAIARHAGIDPSSCSIVTAVLPDGPAAKSGLEAWDVVTGMVGSPVATPSAIRSALRARAPGDVVTLTVRRGQETRSISITLDAWRQVPLAGELQPTPGASAAPAVPQGAPTNLRKGLPTAPNARDSAGRPMPVPQPAPTQP